MAVVALELVCTYGPVQRSKHLMQLALARLEPSLWLSLLLVGVLWMYMYKVSFTLSWTGLLALSSVHPSAFPVHLMLLIPLMLCNSRFPCVPLVACIPVFYNSRLQAPLCFPDIHLTTLAGDLVDHTCQFLLGEGVLHLGE